jgi:hypothetical protein
MACGCAGLEAVLSVWKLMERFFLYLVHVAIWTVCHEFFIES